mmetsp:Transcript_39258/g.98794  ORF Transcript_39258/g.98794 Transcript_39258/m.98794 type:complete len:379 (+) Transcript_39258:96-1232(+)
MKPVVSPTSALPPPQVFSEACQVAAKKAAQPVQVTLILGFSAGALIGIGALLMVAVGACSPELMTSNPGLDAFLKGAVGLPAGLTLVVLTGAELFTSNAFTMLAGVLQGTVPVLALVRNWGLSYTGNFVGSVFLALLSDSAHTLVTDPQVKAAQGIAHLKVSLPFGVAVAKGVLCNWLVCLAVWGALASPSVSGKVLAIFWPISAFVTLGFEHCVANMFIIPQGMLAGADISVSQFLFSNIFPVTLGNIIGATVFVAGIHYLAFGEKTSEGDAEEDESEDSQEMYEDTCNVQASTSQRRTRGVALEVMGSGAGQNPYSQGSLLYKAGLASHERPAVLPATSATALPPYENLDMMRQRMSAAEGFLHHGGSLPVAGHLH